MSLITKRASLFFILSSLVVTFFATAHEKDRHGVQTKGAAEETKKSALEEIAADYERTVRPIFQVKCFDCHSNPRYPWYHRLPGIKQWLDRDIREAHKHMDMSSGFPFKGHGSPSEDLEAIAGTVRKKTMPPLRYILMHWNARLTEAEEKAVLQWVQQSQDKLFWETNK